MGSVPKAESQSSASPQWSWQVPRSETCDISKISHVSPVRIIAVGYWDDEAAQPLAHGDTGMSSAISRRIRNTSSRPIFPYCPCGDMHVGADLCVCPVSERICPSSAEVSPPGQGNHAGLPLR